MDVKPKPTEQTTPQRMQLPLNQEAESHTEIPSEVVDLIGGGGWTRTNDLRIMRTQRQSAPIYESLDLLYFASIYKPNNLN